MCTCVCDSCVEDVDRAKTFGEEERLTLKGTFFLSSSTRIIVATMDALILHKQTNNKHNASTSTNTSTSKSKQHKEAYII
jgi:hypothetical protein